MDDNDILKNYSRQLFSDEVEYVLGYNPELGFNPYWWVVQGAYDKDILSDLSHGDLDFGGADSA